MNGWVVPRSLVGTDALMRECWLVQILGVLGILGGVAALVIGWKGW